VTRPQDAAWICPARGRPLSAARLLGAWRDTGALARLVFAVDAGDPQLPAYLALDADIRVQSGTRWMSGALNRIAPGVAASAAAVGVITDSHLPVTPGWDARLLDALDGGPGVAYPDDRYQREKLATSPLFSSEIVAALGFLAPPGLEHLYLDNWWTDVGTATRLAYCPDVIVDHLHPAAGKAAWDEQWLAHNDPAQFARDKSAYERYMKDRWPGDLARLREHLAVP
jgi:hypothetical protein